MTEIATTKMSAALPMTTGLLRDFGPLPGDEEEWVLRMKSYRNGILSERGLRDKRTTRARLLKDAYAMRHAMHWATEDLVDAWAWGVEAQRLRGRVIEVFSLLTDEQRAEMLRRDEAWGAPA